MARIEPRLVPQPAGQRPMILQVKAADLIYLLTKEGVSVPPHAEISVHIPGGGDYSNTDLEITDEVTIDLRWKE